MNIVTFDSRQFTWQNGRGVADMSDLMFTTNTRNIPNMFYIKSDRTGEEMLFTLDNQAPGYEDSWDGGLKRFVNHERTVMVTIINA